MFAVYIKNIVKLVTVAPLVLACPASAAVLGPVLWASAYRDGKRYRRRMEDNDSDLVGNAALGVAKKAAFLTTQTICAGAVPSFVFDIADITDDALS